MSSGKNPVITEEPVPGWLRYEVEGEKPWFKTPAPRTVIRDSSKLHAFLDKEHGHGRMLEIDGKEFSFKRRLGLRKNRASESNVPQTDDQHVQVDDSTADSNVTGIKTLSIVERLTRNTEVLDHKKLLCKSSKDLDEFRLNDGYQTPGNFEDLKKQVSSSSDLREMLKILNTETPVTDALNLMFSDTCLSEICRIDVKKGPLVEFPFSINENTYCKIVEFAMKICPSLVNFVTNMVVRRGEPVLPSDVLKIATLFSSICYVANNDLDALVKLRSLSLQVDGLTNVGLDILSDMGLAQCARSLSNHRDMLADIGPAVMNNTACVFPYQSTLDNCDLQSEHLTIEVIEKETIDTSELSTARMTKDEALSLFNKGQVLLGLDQNKEERDHLLYVIGVAAGRVIAEVRPEAAKLKKFLPAHHKHENSEKKITPAMAFIIKPYALQETKNPDTIKLLLKIQRQYLRSVAKSKGDDPSFLNLLRVLEDAEIDEPEREAAEETVKIACLEFGELVLHGDLLTVKMIQEAIMLMSGSATAFGRLEYIGPCRLQLLHMKMKKVSQDYSLCMKQEVNFDDVLSLPWLTALTRMKVSNKEKDIKKNDSSFERHDQFLAAVQSSYLVNMFDNFLEKHPERLHRINNTEDAVEFVHNMLDEFNIQLFYDPTTKEPVPEKGEDDLFQYCQVNTEFSSQMIMLSQTFSYFVYRLGPSPKLKLLQGLDFYSPFTYPLVKRFSSSQDMVTRFLLSLTFDLCESEGDAEGLRALRRVMVSYFLAKKPHRLDSKYASFTLIDLVVELSASQRTRKRMDLYVTINPSGTAGGGLFRDKYEEHCVRSVKGCLRGTHGGLDDIKLEKEVGGLSVITEIIQHNRCSVLRGRVGKEHAKDMVGQEVRDQLEENAAKFDPFNRSREEQHKFLDKSRGGPFKGLTERSLEKFIESKKREFKLKAH